MRSSLRSSDLSADPATLFAAVRTSQETAPAASAAALQLIEANCDDSRMSDSAAAAEEAPPGGPHSHSSLPGGAHCQSQRVYLVRSVEWDAGVEGMEKGADVNEVKEVTLDDGSWTEVPRS